jgi:predicted phosphodiesterase
VPVISAIQGEPVKIALISDIHGNLAALEAVVADACKRGVDEFVNLGDSLSGPLLPLETAQFLMAKGWTSLAGNHERQILTHGPERRGASDEYAYSQLTHVEFEWLRSLPPKMKFSPEVFLCHGTPSSDVEYFLETVDKYGARAATSEEVQQRLVGQPSPVIACGHTHIPRAIRTISGQLIVNPGSVGLPAYDDCHPVFHVMETGSPDARYAIVENINDQWIAALLSVPYDHKSMADLAAKNGRPDWHKALLSGYMQ